MEFVWNSAQAEDIRQQSVTAMQGTTDDMKEQAAAFTEQANERQAQADAIQAEAEALQNAPPIMRTITRSGSRRNSDGDLEEYSYTVQVVDEAAMAARARQVEAMLRQVEQLNKEIADLHQAAEILNTAATALSNKIDTTNALFLEMFRMAQYIDGRYAARIRDVKTRIDAYAHKMANIRDSFIVSFMSEAGDAGSFSSSGGGHPAMMGIGGNGNLLNANAWTAISVNPNNRRMILPATPIHISPMLEGVLNKDVWTGIRNILDRPAKGQNGITAKEFSAIAFSFGLMGNPLDQGRFLRYLADPVDLSNIRPEHNLNGITSAWIFCPLKVSAIHMHMERQADIALAELTSIGRDATGRPNDGYLELDKIRRQNMQNMTLLSLAGSLTQGYSFEHPSGHMNVAGAQRVMLNTGGYTIIDGQSSNPPGFPSIMIVSGDDGAINLRMTTTSKWTTGNSPSDPFVSNTGFIGYGTQVHNFHITNGLEPHQGFETVSANARGFVNERYGTPINIVAMGFEKAAEETIGSIIGPAAIPLAFLRDFNKAEMQRQETHSNQLAHIDALDNALVTDRLELNTVIVTKPGSAQQMIFTWESSQTQDAMRRNSHLTGDIDIDDIRQDPMRVFYSLSGMSN